MPRPRDARVECTGRPIFQCATAQAHRLASARRMAEHSGACIGVYPRHAARVDRLKAEQSAEQAQQREAHFAATRGVALQMAKASLAADLQKTPVNDQAGRAGEIKQRMALWRARNQGKGYGREI